MNTTTAGYTKNMTVPRRGRARPCGGDRVVWGAGLFALGRFADRAALLDHASLMLGGGGAACIDIEYLRAQRELFGLVASEGTPYRTLTGLRPGNAATNDSADHLKVIDAAGCPAALAKGPRGRNIGFMVSARSKLAVKAATRAKSDADGPLSAHIFTVLRRLQGLERAWDSWTHKQGRRRLCADLDLDS